MTRDEADRALPLEVFVAEPEAVPLCAGQGQVAMTASAVVIAVAVIALMVKEEEAAVVVDERACLPKPWRWPRISGSLNSPVYASPV